MSTSTTVWPPAEPTQPLPGDTSTDHTSTTETVVPPIARETTDAEVPSGEQTRSRPLVLRLWRGDAADPAWARPALIALLLATAAAYLWDLSASGWANAYYSAAAQAGSQSWTAMFFGSFDAQNAITVDKTPASLWAMALSVRVFGLSSFAILLPQALMGVATVGVLYAAVKRHFGAGAALLAGVVLALTPVAALMFRFNNPDALLTLLMTLGAWATLRAVEKASWRWFALVGLLVGFGFLTKMLQVLLVVPAFGLAYVIAAPTPLRTRLVHSLAGLAGMVVGAGWWVAVVALIPAGSRPYIGGSQANSILELTLGYNGFGRLSGEETGSVGGGNGWGQTGLTRLFDAALGGQASWLLPAALVLFLVGMALRARAPRTDVARAAYIVWGGWLVVTALTFSLMAGIFHEYYTVALAPAIAALVAMGARDLWVRRSNPFVAAGMALLVAASALWAAILLNRSSDFAPGLLWVVAGGGAAAAFVLANSTWLPNRVTNVGAGVAVVALLAGPAAYTLDTVTTPHTGSIVTAGPSTGSGFGPGGGRGGFPGGLAGRLPGGALPGGALPGGALPGGALPGGTLPGGALPGGALPGGTLPGGALPGGTLPGGTLPGGALPGGGMGGLLNASTPSAEVVAALQANADQFRWVAAAVGSQNAAGLQLGTGLPVMSIGGFNGSDPSPTLAQFKDYVAAGQIHYLVAGGGMGGRGGGLGGSGTASEITAWAQANYTQVTMGSMSFYDLTSPLTGTGQTLGS